MGPKGLPRRMSLGGPGLSALNTCRLRHARLEVTVIDKRKCPLEFLNHEIGDKLMYQMRNRGVTFRLGEK